MNIVFIVWSWICYFYYFKRRSFRYPCPTLYFQIMETIFVIVRSLLLRIIDLLNYFVAFLRKLAFNIIMTDTMKRLTARVRYLKRYTNPFWRWADKLSAEDIWDKTKDVYGVDQLEEEETIYSIVCMCKKKLDPTKRPVSEEFHQRFSDWDAALVKAGLISDTLKLHNASDMMILESRLNTLVMVAARCERKRSMGRLPAVRKNPEVKAKRSNTEFKSMTESLNALTRQSLVSQNTLVMNLPDDDSQECMESDSVRTTCTPLSPVDFEIPPSFKRNYPTSFRSATPALALVMSASSDEDTFLSDTSLGLTFPYKSNPLDTILDLTKEIVETKLSLKPEAWISPHFLISTWEMFHFGEEMIGNFMVAPNFLKDEDEKPSLDLFFWSGNPSHPSFYACPIHRDAEGFFLHVSLLRFKSLVSLITHYIFNLTEDIPVLLQHPYLTQLIPSFNLPDVVTLQEKYLIRILEYHPECWLTQDEFDENKVNNLQGSFVIHEDLSKDLVKLHVKMQTTQGFEIESFEINKFEEGFGLSNGDCRFPSLAALLAHYCCWQKDNLPCLKIPISTLPENDTTTKMQGITQMVEEIYIARNLSLHPNCWLLQNTKPDDVDIQTLSTQSLNSFIVAQYNNTYTLKLHYQDSPVKSYNIVKSDGTFSIGYSVPAFPSLPLLIAYYCRNETDVIPLLPMPQFTPGNFQTGPPLQEESLSSFKRSNRSVRLSTIHRKSTRKPSKSVFYRMQQLIMAFKENTTTWSCPCESFAIEKLRVQEYKSFIVVLAPWGKNECYLFVRNNPESPQSFDKFTIYQSDAGNYGFNKDKYTYSSLPCLLAQCCCIQDENLPFILFSDLIPPEDC